MTNTLLRAAAYHEAGHAVVAHTLGYGTPYVEIAADGSGYRAGSGAPGGRDVVEHMVLITMAGPIAEARALRISRLVAWGWSASGDLPEAEGLITGLGGLDPWWNIYESQTAALVREHWPAVDRVARALLARRRLDAAALAELLGAATDVSSYGKLI